MVSQETGDKIQRKRKDDGRVLLSGDAVEGLTMNHGIIRLETLLTQRHLAELPSSGPDCRGIRIGLEQ